MGDEFDLMIRPLLWKQLKVGARVVSTTSPWVTAPDETVHLDQGDAGEYRVHLWTITQEVKNRAANFDRFAATIAQGRAPARPACRPFRLTALLQRRVDVTGWQHLIRIWPHGDVLDVIRNVAEP